MPVGDEHKSSSHEAGILVLAFAVESNHVQDGDLHIVSSFVLNDVCTYKIEFGHTRLSLDSLTN